MRDRYELVDVINFMGYQRAVVVGARSGLFSHYLLKHSALEKLISLEACSKTVVVSRSKIKIKTHIEQATMQYMLEQFGDRSEMRFSDEQDEVAESFDDYQFDMVYMSEPVTGKGLRSQLEAWYPKLRRSGLLCGYGYVTDRWKDTSLEKANAVRESVDEFARERGYEVAATGEPMGTWYFIKKP